MLFGYPDRWNDTLAADLETAPQKVAERTLSGVGWESSVSQNAADVQLLASNTDRTALTIYNDSNGRGEPIHTQQLDFRSGSITEVAKHDSDVCFTPNSGHQPLGLGRPLCAISGSRETPAARPLCANSGSPRRRCGVLRHIKDTGRKGATINT